MSIYDVTGLEKGRTTRNFVHAGRIASPRPLDAELFLIDATKSTPSPFY